MCLISSCFKIINIVLVKNVCVNFTPEPPVTEESAEQKLREQLLEEQERKKNEQVLQKAQQLHEHFLKRRAGAPAASSGCNTFKM